MVAENIQIQEQVILKIFHLITANPNLRICQLLSNAASKNGWLDNDLYHLTDEKLLEALEKY